MFKVKYLLILCSALLWGAQANATVCFLPNPNSDCSDAVIESCTIPTGCMRCSLPRDGASKCSTRSSDCLGDYYKPNDCCDGKSDGTGGKLERCEEPKECESDICTSNGKNYCKVENCKCPVSDYPFTDENCKKSKGDECEDSDGTHYEDCDETPDEPAISVDCKCAINGDGTSCLDDSFPYQSPKGQVPSYIQFLGSIEHSSYTYGDYVCATSACCTGNYWNKDVYLKGKDITTMCQELGYTESTTCPAGTNTIRCPFYPTMRKCLSSGLKINGNAV